MNSQESKKNARLQRREKMDLEDVLEKLRNTPIEDLPTFNLPQVRAHHEEVEAFKRSGFEELYFGRRDEIKELISEIEQLESDIAELEDEHKMLVSQLDSALGEHKLKYTEAEGTETRLNEMIKAIPILFRFKKPGKKPEYEPHRNFRISIETYLGAAIVACIDLMKDMNPGRPVIDSSDEENGLAYELARRLEEEGIKEWKYEFIRKTWTARGDYVISS